MKTPTMEDVATSLKLHTEDLVFFNRRLYPDLKRSSRPKEGTLLRIPLFPKGYDPLRRTTLSVSKPIKMLETAPMVKSTKWKGEVSLSGLWYCTKEHDTPVVIAKRIKSNADEIVVSEEGSCVLCELT